MSSTSQKEKKLSEDEILEIKNQIEYYLSDANLEKDYFFHEKISSSSEGYLPLQLLLKCNKIKNKGWTKEDLKKGIQLSKEIELDETGEKVRRKYNSELPELLLLAKKRKNEKGKRGSKKEDKKEEEEKEEEEKTIDKNEKGILKITCKEKTESPWKKIHEEFTKVNPDLNVEYGRFKEKEGNIGILLKKDQKFEDVKFVDKFKVDEIEFKVEKCEGGDLINFWKEHGSHYEYCLKKREKHNKNKESRQKNKKYLSKPVRLGKKEYNNIDLVKAQTKKILNKYKDNVKLEGEDKDFILDLLKYHHNYDEKVKDMDYIVAAPNEMHKYSRCFYIIDKNNNKKDFSSKKCIENIIEKINKE